MYTCIVATVRAWSEGMVDRWKKKKKKKKKKFRRGESSVLAIFQLIDGKNDRAPSLAQIFDNIFIVAA